MSAKDAGISHKPDIRPTQVHVSTSVVSGNAMRRGAYEVDLDQCPSAFVPPTIENLDQYRVMFFGRLLGYPNVEQRLREAADRYTPKVSKGVADWLSHILAWDIWEHCKKVGISPVGFRMDHICRPSDGWKRYDVPDEYGDLILRLCDELRLGWTWPRVLHSAVVTYRQHTDNPSLSQGEPTFELFLPPNLVDTRPNVLDGFWVFNRVKLTVPGGHEVIVSPDESREHALARVDDLDVRVSLRKDWPKIRRKMSSLVGYRRRKMLVAGQQHIEWLYRWHILGDNADKIAEESMVSPSVVEDTVKALRKQLDLQISRSVRSGSRRRRLSRL